MAQFGRLKVLSGDRGILNYCRVALLPKYCSPFRNRIAENMRHNRHPFVLGKLFRTDQLKGATLNLKNLGEHVEHGEGESVKESS